MPNVSVPAPVALEAFEYDLPAEAIAQRPAEPRTAARMLVATDSSGVLHHATVGLLPRFLEPGDLLVVNETRVSPSRLHLHKTTGGLVEVLLVEPLGAGRWEALVRPGRRTRPGTILLAGDTPAIEVGGELSEGGVRMVSVLDAEAVGIAGTIALPPYIHEPLDDPSRYQTVYARAPGSVAAPTAGLHFSEELLDECRSVGAEIVAVDLTIGLDTFRPITADRPEDHLLHSEAYSVPAETIEACQRARRVIAVGTTTVRALETVAATGELCGRTSLFIRGSYPFQVVDVLLTNFHLPRTSLLVLLDAFCGCCWRQLYEVALTNGYRFASFGDAMLVGRLPQR